MKYAIAILFALSPVTAHAGLLFGSNNRTVIVNQGAPVTGYSMRYGYSEVHPPYRTYRTYRGSVQSGYLVPAPAAVEGPVVTVTTKTKHRHSRHGHKTTTTVRESQ